MSTASVVASLDWPRRLVLACYFLAMIFVLLIRIPREVPAWVSGWGNTWEAAGSASLWEFRTPPRAFAEYTGADPLGLYSSSRPRGYINPALYRYARVDRARLFLEVVSLTALCLAVLLLLPRRKQSRTERQNPKLKPDEWLDPQLPVEFRPGELEKLAEEDRRLRRTSQLGKVSAEPQVTKESRKEVDK